MPGQWPKVALLSRELAGLEGTARFINLDSVIVFNIDCYFTNGDPQDLITARNWVRIFTKSGQTSAFRFPVGGHPDMLENLKEDRRILLGNISSSNTTSRPPSVRATVLALVGPGKTERIAQTVLPLRLPTA